MPSPSPSSAASVRRLRVSAVSYQGSSFRCEGLGFNRHCGLLCQLSPLLNRLCSRIGIANLVGLGQRQFVPLVVAEEFLH